MALLSKEQMSQVLQLVRSMDHATWSPLVDMRAEAATEHLVLLLRRVVPAEHFDAVQDAFKEVLKVEVAGALLEAVKSQREGGTAAARKGKAAKHRPEWELTQRVAMQNLGPDGRMPTLRSLVEPVREARAAAGLKPEKIAHSTIAKHVEGFVLVSFYQSETDD